MRDVVRKRTGKAAPKESPHHTVTIRAAACPTSGDIRSILVLLGKPPGAA